MLIVLMTYSIAVTCFFVTFMSIDAKQVIVREEKAEIQLNCVSSKFLIYLNKLSTVDYELHYIILFYECMCSGSEILTLETDDFHWLGSDELVSFRLAFGHDKAPELFWDYMKKKALLDK